MAAHVRRYAGRSNELRERDQAITWGVDFLRLAAGEVFKFAEQGSRYREWSAIDDHDPDEKTSARSAEAYARKSIVAADVPTGIRYVRAGWFQEFVRRTGATVAAAEVMGLMLDVGWKRPGREGRIKATDPNGVGKPIVAAFYVVPAGWEDAQEAAE